MFKRQESCPRTANLAGMLYLDHSATTPMLPEVLEAMLPLMTQHFGNPSGIHSVSRVARDYLEVAREQVAECLHCSPKEVIFTSGGTEANSLAVLGLANRRTVPGHIVSTQIEHAAVREALSQLERRGHSVTYLRPDSDGLIAASDVAAELRSDTFLVTVMLANNEIGTLQPVNEIAQLCEGREIAFHTDAVQAAGKLPLLTDDMRPSTLAISAHKFGGPRGMGVLFARAGHQLEPVLPGGGQEFGRRSGTQNVAGAVGLARALSIAVEGLDANVRAMCEARNFLIRELTMLPNVVLTGHPTRRLPHIASFRIPDVDGQSLVVLLDRQGICASTGSACSSGTVQASAVLRACGLSETEARGSLRLSVAPSTPLSDLARVKEAVQSALALELETSGA